MAGGVLKVEASRRLKKKRKKGAFERGLEFS